MSNTIFEKTKTQGHRIVIIEYSNKGWIFIISDSKTEKEIKRVIIRI